MLPCGAEAALFAATPMAILEFNSSNPADLLTRSCQVHTLFALPTKQGYFGPGRADNRDASSFWMPNYGRCGYPPI